MPRPRLVVLFCALGVLSGCGPADNLAISADCTTTADAKLLLLWTIDGQPADATSCASIAKLDLVISSDLCTGSVEIDPIVPCARGGVAFRYDNVPRGGALLQLTALDAANRPRAAGSVRATLGPALPTVPQLVDLR